MAIPVIYFSFVEIKPIRGSVTPKARSGHRLVYYENSIYSIGGFNPDVEETNNLPSPLFQELWKFNLTTCRWVKIRNKGKIPPELASHSASVHGDHLIVLGGTGVPFGETASNRLHVCNLKSLEWEYIGCDGHKPTPVYGHSQSIWQHYLYKFGGTTGWLYNSDVHRLDLKKKLWEIVHVYSEKANEPCERYRQEMICYKSKLFIIGGGLSWSVFSMDKIHVFCLREEAWKLEQTMADSVKGFPSPRRCHSCVSSDNGDMYMCGGYDGENVFSDVWKLDLNTLQWTCLPVTMDLPVYFHSSALTRHGTMIVFGGVTNIDSSRTSKLFSIQLKILPLCELAWSKVLHSAEKRLEFIEQDQLLRLGIPREYIDRLEIVARPS